MFIRRRKKSTPSDMFSSVTIAVYARFNSPNYRIQNNTKRGGHLRPAQTTPATADWLGRGPRSPQGSPRAAFAVASPRLPAPGARRAQPTAGQTGAAADHGPQDARRTARRTTRSV